MDENIGKEKMKPKSEARKNDHVTRRVLAPFLMTYKKKPLLNLTEVKEEFQNVYSQTKPKEVLGKLAAFFTDSLELPTVLNETSEILKTVTKSWGSSLYLVEQGTNYIILNPKYISKNERHTVRYQIEPGTTVAAYVAYAKEFVFSEDILGDPRFPLGIPGAGHSVRSVLCVPVLTAADDGRCIAVIELYRDMSQEPFNAVDLQIAVSLSGWMGAAIHQNDEKLFLLKQIELNRYLLSLVQLFFSRAVPFDKFISDIVVFAKTSVGAERGSFYVIENAPEGFDEEIVADVYEEGIDSSAMAFKKKNKQR